MIHAVSGAAKPRLHVFIPTLDGAGCERAMATVLPELARSFAVTLVLHRDEIGYRIPSSIAVEVLGIPARHGMARLLGFRAAYDALRRHLAEQRPDVLLSCLDLNNVVAVMARDRACPALPVVCVEQTVDARWAASALDGKYHRNLWPITLRYAYRRANALVVLTQAMATHLGRWGVCGRMSIVPNPVDVDLFRPLRSGEAFPGTLDSRFTAARVRLLAVGRLVPQKNPLLLVELMCRLRRLKPEAELFVLGAGPLDREVREVIVRRGVADRMHLLGWRDDVAVYMRHAHALVHAARYESFGNVCFEALASGIPTVATECSDAFTQFVRPGVPLFISPAGDADALGAAVLEALAVPASGRMAGRSVVERELTVERIASRYADVVRSVLPEAMAAAC